MESEKVTERYLCLQMKILRGKAFKWVDPTTRGVPDRICIFPTGQVVFVELKSEGAKPKPHQACLLNYLQDLNCEVAIVDTKAKVDQLIRRYNELPKYSGSYCQYQE